MTEDCWAIKVKQLIFCIRLLLKNVMQNAMCIIKRHKKAYGRDKATTYQCSLYHSDTRGISSDRLIRPDLILKGRGANSKEIPAAVVSV